jgi:hypothetical protein
MDVRRMAQDSGLRQKRGPLAKRATSRGDDYSRTRHQKEIDDVRSCWRARNAWDPCQERDLIVSSVRKYCDRQIPSRNMPDLLDQIGEILVGGANSANMCELLTEPQAPKVTATDVDCQHRRPQRIQFSFVLVTYHRQESTADEISMAANIGKEISP